MKKYLPLLLFAFLAGCASGNEPQQTNIPKSNSQEALKLKAAVSAEPLKILEEEGVEYAYPRWSKDGRQVLFQGNKSGKWHLYLMHADGSNIRQLTTGNSNNNYPDWSADNAKIAFVSDREGNEDVYVMNLDGSNLQNLTNHPARDIHPYFAPDGQSLLFNSSRDNENSFEIYQLSANGNNLKRLTQTPEHVETCARFSPDGKQIVYLRGHLEEANDDVYLMHADGSEIENLTQSAGSEGWPVWSADGKKVVYSNSDPGNFSLFEIDVKSRQKKQLSFAEYPFEDARASLSPATGQVMFNRKKGATIGIYILPDKNISSAR